MFTPNRRATLGLLGVGLATTAIGHPFRAAIAQSILRPAVVPSQYFFLTTAEASFLSAACDRLIPPDDYPSATQAGVVDFIDLQLATGWGKGEGLYLEEPVVSGTESQGYQLGLTPAELYREAIATADSIAGQDGFSALSTEEQDSFLKDLENGKRDLGSVPGSVFFQHLRQNTIEGYFADPLYNGNRDLAGWAMIGFPGAHAYYITEVGRHGMDYFRPPQGMAWRPGVGPAEPFTGVRQQHSNEQDSEG